jgi:hypothetical protein
VTGNTGLRRFVAPPPASQETRAPARQAPAGPPASDQVLPDQVLPDQALPDQALPDQALSDQALFDQALSDQVRSAMGQPPADAPARDAPARDAPARDAPARDAPASGEESCEFCAAQVAVEHGHVADLEASTLMCACRACYLLFTHGQAARGRYRSVPDRYLRDPGRPLSPAEWDALEIPVGLAFFLRSSDDDTVTAFYPSPAGATECRLDLEAWGRIAAARPLLGAAAPDVEAILISRGSDGVEYFVVPIDACYELAGRMRLHWRGFDGGAEARQSIAEFLDSVRARSRDFS